MTLEVCITEPKKNLGKTKCTAIPKLFKRVIETPLNWYLDVADYATAAALKIKLQALLTNPINNRGYLFPPFAAPPEDNSEESIFEVTPYGRVPVRDGQYRFKHGISQDLCTHIALASHRSLNSCGVMYLDVDNQLLLTERDGDGKLYPLSVAMLWTEKLKLSSGANSSISPFVIDLADNEEIDKRGVLIDGSIVNTLEPLTDVEITLATGDAFDAAGFMVDVKQSCDKVPVSGLLVADFLFYAADGITLQAKLSAAPDANVPGRYNLLPPGGNPFELGTLTLRAAADLTVKAYEVPVALTVTI